MSATYGEPADEAPQEPQDDMIVEDDETPPPGDPVASVEDFHPDDPDPEAIIDEGR